MALGRGLLRAMGLPGAGEAALAELEAQREAYLEDAIPTLQSYSGLNEPGRGRPGALEGLAAAAWANLRDSDQVELRDLALGMAGRVEGAAGRLGRRGAAAIYRDAAVRAAIEGSGPQARARSGASPAPLLGLLVLGALVAGVGYLATRPRIDLEPPELIIEAPDEVVTTRAKVVGEVLEEDLVALEVDARSVPFEALGGGRYRFEIELEDLEVGTKEVEITATDGGGRSARRKVLVVRAPAPAKIEVSEPQEGAGTREGSLEVRGRVEAPFPVASIRVGARSLPLNERGEFSGRIELSPREGRYPLTFSVETPTVRGELVREVLVDRTPPKVEVLEHSANCYGATFDLPLRLDDASPALSVELNGRLHPVKLRSGRVVHVEVPLGPIGRQTIAVRALDASGNASPPIQVSVERLAPREGPLAAYRTGQRSFKVTEDVVVPAGQVLVIPPGSRVEVAPGKELRIEGELRAPGSPSATIMISGQGWGGIRLKGEAALAELSYTELRGASNKLGGALYVSLGARAKATHCTFVGNAASQNGGAIYVVGSVSSPSKLELVDVTFEDNKAEGEAGALNLNSYCRAQLERVEFKGNRAGSYGGALVLIGFLNSTTEGELSECRFSGNQATHGGAIQVGRNARARASECVFEENIAATHGGAILLHARGADERGVLELSGGRLVRNRAKQGGGALALGSFANAVVSRVDFEENSTGGKGGAVFVSGAPGGHSKLSLVEAHLVGNHADGSGGGLFVGAYSEAHAERTQLRGNVAREWGGGLAAAGAAEANALPSRVELLGCTFKQNRVADLQSGSVRRRAGRGDALRIGGGVEFDPAQVPAAGIAPAEASLAAGLSAPAPRSDAAGGSPSSSDASPALPTTPQAPASRALNPAPAGREGAPAAAREGAAAPPKEAPGEAKLPQAPEVGRALVLGADDDFGRALGHYVAAALHKNYLALRDRPYGHGSSRLQSYYAKIEFPGVVSTRIWDSGERHYACVTIANTAPDGEASAVFEDYLARLKSHLGQRWEHKHHQTKHGGRIHEFEHEHVRLRLTLTRYELSSETRATVMLFFN